jgi:C-terminal processing protease CtpA/Prc
MKFILLAFSSLILSACSNFEVPKRALMDVHSDRALMQVKSPPAGSLITAKELQNDLVELNTILDSVHPDPNFTMDLSEVKTQIKKFSDGITSSMTHHEAWKYFSQLNPYFQDGHMVISYPNFAQDLNHHIKNGGRLFPFKVTIDESHRIFVSDVQNNNTDISIGDEITSINGVSALKIIDVILSRMHGDTIKNRIALAANRFTNMYWLLYGDTGNYQIDVLKNNEQKIYYILGSNKSISTVDTGIGEFVQREILDDGIGYLRVDRFYYTQEQEKSYFKFMKDTWQEFRNANVQDVIIDVRKNSGGTDHYWQQGIAPYIASKPFLFLSEFKVRMTERNIRMGPVRGELGSIIEGPFEQLVPVSGHNNLRIPGQAYLLMDNLSYSSTILFLTALKDSKQAIIAGQSSARSCTTGRIETSSLPGSKLELTIPTLIFIRPSGKSLCAKPIKPDIFISDDPLDPSIAVSTLTKLIKAKR